MHIHNPSMHLVASTQQTKCPSIIGQQKQKHTNQRRINLRHAVKWPHFVCGQHWTREWLTARVGVSACVSTLLLSHNEDGTERAPRRTRSPRQRRPADGHQMNKLWRGPRIVMGSNAPPPRAQPALALVRPPLALHWQFNFPLTPHVRPPFAPR